MFRIMQVKQLQLITIGVFLISLINSVAMADVSNSTAPKNLTRAQWQEDLAVLDVDIRQHHINPFWFKDEAGYKKLYQQALHYIEQAEPINSTTVNGYFEKLVAYISDGHSYVVNKAARFGVFPYGVEWFADGLFITSTAPEYKHLLGAKILAFDGMGIEQANKRIASFIPVVNDSGFRSQSRDAYHFAGLIYAAGVSKKADSVELSLELPNGEKTKQIFGLRQNNTPFVDLQELQEKSIPLYRQQQDKKQWFIFLEKEKAIYLRYTLVIEDNKDDIKNITKQIIQFMDSHDVQKLIIDARDNMGGDSFLNAPLINAIANYKNINQRGRLFVITNHNTFSAAINFAGNMEIKTRALFVGEQVGDRATFAGEVGPQAKHTLPNSGIVVSLSFSEWNTTYDGDKRGAVALNIPVKLTMEDFLYGRDPVLQACLDYRTETKEKITTTKLSENNYSNWIGRYDYSPDKALKIYTDNNGELKMELTELVFSSLYPAGKNKLATDLISIKLKRLANGDLEILQTKSKPRNIHKLDNNNLKPLELLMAGQFNEAKSAYRKVYDQNPHLLSIRGNSLGILASHIRARYQNQNYYDQLREIAISLHGSPIASWDDDE